MAITRIVLHLHINAFAHPVAFFAGSRSRKQEIPHDEFLFKKPSAVYHPKKIHFAF
ncbi:hypothetical protein [Deinococcus roseus]|uniref:hypothetical protein n=1 Tax=Deinococcus roseus TaxID=392414 RepID=UPI001663CCC6|nr:hypothetical protein [Deinococcus roseus]